MAKHQDKLEWLFKCDTKLKQDLKKHKPLRTLKKKKKHLLDKPKFINSNTFLLFPLLNPLVSTSVYTKLPSNFWLSAISRSRKESKKEEWFGYISFDTTLPWSWAAMLKESFLWLFSNSHLLKSLIRDVIFSSL